MTNCVKSIELENGLTLKIQDASRSISDDGCVVKAIVTIDFPLTDQDAIDSGLSLEELTRRLGSEGRRFEKQLERNFIKKADKEAVFEAITTSFLATSLKYLSQPHFKKGVIRRLLAGNRAW